MNSAPTGMLAGKVIVVIGGTSGIGLSGAKAFIAAGARVVALGLDETTVVSAKAELGSNAIVLQGDATAADAATKAIQEALKHFDTFDGLFHVAGGSGRRFGDGPLHKVSDDAWRKTLELNLTSVMLSNRAAVQHWLAAGTGGVVLNVGSVLARSPATRLFGTLAYATAKAAIEGFTRSCAAQYAPHNIRFNVLAPGLVATPMSQRAQADAVIGAYIKSKQPLDGGRIATPSDIDGAAVYLMSDAARFVTDQVLTVDGGWSVTEGHVSGTQ